MSIDDQIPLVFADGTVEYHPGSTMVRWPQMKSAPEPLSAFGRVLRTGGDSVRMPDGRMAQIEGWQDEALRLRRNEPLTASEAIMQAADVLARHGYVGPSCELTHGDPARRTSPVRMLTGRREDDAAAPALDVVHALCAAVLAASDSGYVVVKKRDGAEAITPAESRFADVEAILRRGVALGWGWLSVTADAGGVSRRERLAQELAELDVALVSGDRSAIADEIGDVLIVLMSLALAHGVNPSDALAGAVAKVSRRLTHAETHGAGPHPSNVLRRLWNEAKALDRDVSADKTTGSR